MVLGLGQQAVVFRAVKRTPHRTLPAACAQELEHGQQGSGVSLYVNEDATSNSANESAALLPAYKSTLPRGLGVLCDGEGRRTGGGANQPRR